MKQRCGRTSPCTGFTVLELLVVVAIMGFLSVAALESMRIYVPRFELRQASNQAAQLINKARLEAIKRGVTTVVEADPDERTLRAFAEINGTSANPTAATGNYLVYDPDPLAPFARTDYLIAQLTLPGKDRTGAQLGGPQHGVKGADSVVGFTHVSHAVEPHDVLVFLSTGAVRDPGAFRFADARGANFLETALTSITGGVEVRKYLRVQDSPNGSADFFAEGNESFDADSVGENIWVWY